MWSDRVTKQQQAEIRAQLLEILPTPATDAHELRTTFPESPSVEQAAHVLHRESGFSYLNSGPRGPALFYRPLVAISYKNGRARISSARSTAILEAPAFDILEAALEVWSDAPGATLAGHLSYDLAAELEEVGPLPDAGFEFPQLYFGLYDRRLELDRDSGQWSAVSTTAWDSVTDDRAGDWGARLLQRASAASLPEPAVSVPATIHSIPDQAGFEQAVTNTVRTIHAGDIFQTNICRKIETEFDAGHAWDLFRKLRRASPARYEAFLHLHPPDSNQVILSISPELYLKVRGNVAETGPIKGTRQRGTTDRADRALIEELLSSEKDRAELAMIVDVSRNDLGRVSEIGSVGVEAHGELMTLPTVHHSFSTVRGHLRDDASFVDLLRASFPAASISGAPKIEAIRVALREEKQLRGPCMGAIGWISLGKGEHRAMEMSVAIRTAFVSDGLVRYYAGCGITADSDPAAEFEESEHKAAAFLRALE